MLDIKYLGENNMSVKNLLAKRGQGFDLDHLFKLDGEHKKALLDVENLRADRNKFASQKDQEKGRLVKEALKLAEEKLTNAEHGLNDAMARAPNVPHQSVPSKTAGDKVEKVYGEKPKFDFKPKDHLELGETLDIIDVKRASKVSGSRFAYLKNQAVFLEFGLVRWVFDKLAKKGFTPVIPPVLVKGDAMFGTGFFPAEPNEYFKMAQDDLYLAGTAEVPLAAYRANETFLEDKLPIKYAGFSSCFRREAGTYGKITHGLIRVHQFDKVEMFVFAHPEKSWKMFEELANISEEIYTQLGFHFRKVAINAGELGAPNAKKYDFEVWLPSQQRFLELASCSHDTDFQARRLNIRFRSKNGKSNFVHTLNNTAIAIGRALAVILENYQLSNGGVKIPKVLHPYLSFKEIKR